MFKIHYGICVLCNQESLLVVKKMWCDKCNYEQKQNKKKLAGKKSGKYKYIKKATGEKDVFEAVLDNLPDGPTKCFVCDITVALVTHHNMAHVLAKGKYPKARLDPNNIRVLCYNIQGTGCHSKYDFYPHGELKGEGWERLFKLRDELKEQYKHK
jgi:hypothetical protein